MSKGYIVVQKRYIHILIPGTLFGKGIFANVTKEYEMKLSWII